MLSPLSPFSPVAPVAPVSPLGPAGPVSPLAPVAPSLPSLPFLPSFTIVVVTEPLSKSVIVIVWVPSSLSTTSPVMLPPFSPFSPVSPLGPTGPVSPLGPAAPVSPLAPSLISVVVDEPSGFTIVSVWVPLLLLVIVAVGLLPSLPSLTLGTLI